MNILEALVLLLLAVNAAVIIYNLGKVLTITLRFRRKVRRRTETEKRLGRERL